MAVLGPSQRTSQMRPFSRSTRPVFVEAWTPTQRRSAHPSPPDSHPPSTLRFLFQDRLNFRMARDQGEQIGSSSASGVQEVLTYVCGVRIPGGHHPELVSHLLEFAWVGRQAPNRPVPGGLDGTVDPKAGVVHHSYNTNNVVPGHSVDKDRNTLDPIVVASLVRSVRLLNTEGRIPTSIRFQRHANMDMPSQRVTMVVVRRTSGPRIRA